MGWTRRAFLRQVGITLATLGVGEAGWFTLCDRYQAALAAPTPRKLALLIGINQYSEDVCDYLPNRGTALNGCLTDVELQRELLIHRFGFSPANILTLVDQQATRQGIEDAFLSHLTDQARAGDSILIHFSGLGSRVRLEGNGERDRTTLVPVDGRLPTVDDPVLHDLSEETLGLLLRTLLTDQVTTVLDCSDGDANLVLPPGWRVRTRPSTPNGSLDEAERALQATLLAKLQDAGGAERATWTGMRLSAAQSHQPALEGQWNGFQAGLFTYSLTRSLWEALPATTLWFSLGNAVDAITRLTSVEQQPQATGNATQERNLSPYFTAPVPQGGIGVLTAIDEDGRGAELWLGGLSPYLLDYYGVGSVLSLVSTENGNAETVAVVQVRSRIGLTAQTRLLTEGTVSQVGQLVQERVRLLPRSVSLNIALDSSLERIERVDATSAFAALSRVVTMTTGEQVADYWFGRYQPPSPPLVASLPANGSPLQGDPAEGKGNSSSPQGGYALLTGARTSLPGTLVVGEAAVKTAVSRLAPQVQSLLALKWLRLTENASSSDVAVRVVLETEDPLLPALCQETHPAVQERSRLIFFNGKPGGEPAPRPLLLADGTSMRYRLQNLGNQPLYVTLLGLNGEGNAIALYPRPTLEDNLLPPKSTLLIPLTAAAPTWSVAERPALAEAYVLFSPVPLHQTYALLGKVGHSTSGNYRIGSIPNALDATQAMLQDLHQGKAIASIPDAPVDSYTLPLNLWASLGFTYGVVNSKNGLPGPIE